MPITEQLDALDRAGMMAAAVPIIKQLDSLFNATDGAVANSDAFAAGS